MLALVSYQISYAQDTIRIEDILKKQAKESPSKSKQGKQTGKDFEKALNVLRQAVETCIYSIEVQYHLVKDKKFYGKGDSDYFGYTKAFAISTGKQLLIDPTFMEPWNSDPDFQDYKDEYKPEIYKLIVQEHDKSASNEYLPNQFTYREQDGIGSIELNKKSLTGIEQKSSVDQPGFILLFYEPKKGKEPDVAVSFCDKVSLMNKNTYDQESLLGGFYFQMMPSQGIVECKLSGIIVKSKKGKAELVEINKSNSTGVNVKPSEESKSSKPVLREVKQKK